MSRRTNEVDHRETGPRLADLRFILRGNKRGLAFLSLGALVTAVSEAFLLGAVVQAISTMSSGGTLVSVEVGTRTIDSDVQTLLAVAVLAAVVRGCAAGIVALSGPRIAASSRERHRNDLFGSYLAADWATQSADKTGRLMQILSSSVNEANTVVALMTLALPALLTLVVLLVVALLLNPVVTSCLILVGVSIALALRPLSARAGRAAQADAAGRNATAAHIAGVLAAGAEISVLGSARGVLDLASRRIGEAERAYARAQGFKRLGAMATQSLAFLIAAAGLWLLSASEWDVNYTTVGTITVLLLRGAGLAQQVQGAASQYGAVAPFIQQIRTTVDFFRSRRQVFGDHPFPARCDITMRDVDYTYPGSSTTVIRIPEITFAQGTSTAIVGPSGSGKSTLVQLVLRLRSPTRGVITVGGVRAGEIDQRDFSAHVAYVPQSPHLVPGTVRENIRFFRPWITDADVVRAAELAHIHDEIVSMDDGYATVLDGHVDMLSGGQKQRLALARALTSSPDILVLDEPTSALDATNEAAVLDTLQQLRGRTTVIVITHKASTITLFDSVLLVEGGALRPMGTSEIADHR